MAATSALFVDEFDAAKRREMSWGAAFFSWTLLLFYGALFGATLAASFLV